MNNKFTLIPRRSNEYLFCFLGTKGKINDDKKQNRQKRHWNTLISPKMFFLKSGNDVDSFKNHYFSRFSANEVS